MSPLARWCQRHRTAVVVAWVCLLLALGAGAGAAGSAFGNSPPSQNTDSARAAALLRQSSNSAAGRNGRIVWRVDTGSVADAAPRQRMTEALAHIVDSSSRPRSWVSSGPSSGSASQPSGARWSGPSGSHSGSASISARHAPSESPHRASSRARSTASPNGPPAVYRYVPLLTSSSVAYARDTRSRSAPRRENLSVESLRWECAACSATRGGSRSGAYRGSVTTSSNRTM